MTLARLLGNYSSKTEDTSTMNQDPFIELISDFTEEEISEGLYENEFNVGKEGSASHIL